MVTLLKLEKIGNIFQLKKEAEEWEMHVDMDICWNKVALLMKSKKFGEKPFYLTSDPKMVVFLSEAE